MVTKKISEILKKSAVAGLAATLIFNSVPVGVLAKEVTEETAAIDDTAGFKGVRETDGSHLYTVEFTYNDLQYVMPGDSSVSLSEILDTVGLTGEVSAVETSDESLFSADRKDGEWIVTAHKAFGSTEWMKVTIGGVVYEITVTDTNSVKYVDASGTEHTVDNVTEINSNMTASLGTDGQETWYVVSSDVTFNNNISIKGNVNLILADGKTMSVGTDNERLAKPYGISGTQIGAGNLTIYGQSLDAVNAGCLKIFTRSSNGNVVYLANYTQHSGNVLIDGFWEGAGEFMLNGIDCRNTFTLDGGTLNISTTQGNAIITNLDNINILGGVLNATGAGEGCYGLCCYGNITLGYTCGTDRITVSSYDLGSNANTVNVNVKDGQLLADGSGNFYCGDITASVGALAGKTLQPATEALLWHADASHDGSSADKAYIIDSAAGLDLLAYRVNNGTDYEGKYFKLGADITYSHTTEWNNSASTENNYTAIGGSKSFKGHFDGQGHTVSGIRIYKDADKKQGLFGKTGNGAEVKNIVLAEARITGASYTGGIVGLNDGGTVTNCRVLSSITIHSIVSNVNLHGGVVGYVSGSGIVSGCVSEANVTIKDGLNDCERYGGVVGRCSKSAVRDCLFLGSTVGGTANVGAVVGYSYGDGNTVTNCYYTSDTITGKDNSGTDLGNAGCAVGYKDNYSTVTNVGKAYTITLGNGVTLGGTATAYDTRGITAYGSSALSYNNGTATTVYSTNGATVTLTATPAAGYVLDTVTATKEGGGTVTVNGTGNTRTFTMPAKNVTVSATFTKTLTADMIEAIPDQTYTGSAIVPAVTVKDGNVALTKDTDYTVAYTNNTNAAKKTSSSAPTVTITGKGNYSSTSTATAKFTINPMPVVVSGFTASDRKYDGRTFVTLNGDNILIKNVNGGTISDSGLSVTAKGNLADAKAGENKTVNISDFELYGTNAGNYVLAETGQQTTTTANISKRVITITAKDQSVELNKNITTGTDQVNLSGDGLASGQTLSAVTLTSSSTAAITTSGTITPSAAVIKSGTTDVTSNYNITYVKGKLTVTKVKAKVTAAPKAKTGLVYTGKAQSLITAGTADTSMEYAMGENGSTAPTNGYSSTVPNGTDARTSYYVWYRGAADANHDPGNAQCIPVEIGKAPLTVTAKPKTITYGEAPTNDGVTYNGFVNNENESNLTGTLSYTYNYSQYGNAGNSYTITPKGLTSGNYDITFKPGTLTVNKKEVSLNWTNTTLSYNGLEQAPTATADGLVNNDSCTVTVSGATDVGTYTATAIGLSNGNYKLPATGTTAEFTINKAVYGGTKTAYATLKPSEPVTDVVITLPDLPEGAVYAASGVVSGDTELIASHSVTGNTLTFSATEQAEPKTAVITVPVSGAKNYLDYEVKATITSKKDAGVSIKGGDRAVTYGDDGFTLEREVAYPGDNGHWTFTSRNPDIAKADSKTGEVEIVSAGEALVTAVYESDTTFGKDSITLTVEKAASQITKAPEAKSGLVYNGNDQELIIPAEAEGGEIKYALAKSDAKPDDSEYSSSIPVAKDAGTYTVWYMVFGDKNHYDSEAKSIKVEIAEITEKKPDRVPLTQNNDAYAGYASPEDNFASIVRGASSDGTGGNIKKQELDFSNVLTSGVDPSSLKMTALAGSKFTTMGKVKDKDSVKTTGGVKAKFNKKDGTVTITCKSSGSATFTMEDGDTYTVNFTVEKPKAMAAAKTMAAGGSTVTRTLLDLFGTHIDSGKLSIQKQKHSQATLSGNTLIVNPVEKDSIKIQYQYLNKKYKIAIKVK